MQSDNEFLRELGLKIKELREAKQLSQQELADLAEVAKSTIQRLEKGKFNVSILKLKRILDTFDIEINY